jgi:hypothetical protein
LDTDEPSMITGRVIVAASISFLRDTVKRDIRKREREREREMCQCV